MIEYLLVANLASAVETPNFKVMSCQSERFELIESPIPSWPVHIHQSEESPKVEIKFLVDSKGEVGYYKVIKANPKRGFIRPSTKALKKWKFNKSDNNERCFKVTFRFTLNS